MSYSIINVYHIHILYNSPTGITLAFFLDRRGTVAPCGEQFLSKWNLQAQSLVTVDRVPGISLEPPSTAPPGAVADAARPERPHEKAEYNKYYYKRQQDEEQHRQDD